MTVIKDAADLFAAKGEEARDIVENMKNDAQDALGLALSEAPSSRRERYLYATERIFPLLLRLEDEGERGAALDDVANDLKLGKRDLRKAFARFENRARREREGTERDEEAAEDLAPEPGTERHDRATGLLRCPDILEAAARDMERLGHVGEPTAKKLLFVCAISASAGFAIQPSIHAESSSGKNFLADTVLSLLPPEKVIKRSAISAKALYRTEESLAGRVLYLQEHAGSEDADFTFRVMQSDGKLVYEATEQGPDGGFRTVVHEKEGPLVIVQTTTDLRLFDENATRVFAIHLDESAQQTERVVRSALARAAKGGIPKEERDVILQGWHDAIRLLGAAEVIVPYAERIEAPSRLVRMRRDINRLLDVIRVLAWLHQHARERDGLGRILAAEADFRIALALVGDSLRRAWESLTPAEEAVLKAVQSLPKALQRNGFTRNDIPTGDLATRRVQDALKALTESGYLEREGRRGPHGHRYTVSRDPESRGLGISLNAADGDHGDDGAEGPDAAAGENLGQAGDQGEEDEEGDVGRGIARTGERAIEGPLSPGKGAIARPRGVDGGGYLEGEEPEEEEEVDCLAELTELGWYRAGSAFVAENVPEGVPLGEEWVADALCRRVPIYRGGREKRRWHVGHDTPLVLSAEEVPELEDEEPQAGARPTKPEEMGARLRRLVNLLQQGTRRFYDPSFDEWCFESRINASPDSPNRFKEAYLHAELWRNEGTGEELWALVALREGWRVPEEAIEEAVWSRVAPRPTTDKIVLEVSDSAFEF